jgi:hypothetical protein
MTTQDIIREIAQITDDKDLEEIQSYSFERRRTLDRAKADTIGWRVGQQVKMKREHQNTRPYGETGTVTKVNSVKLKVRFLNNNWNIPKTMLDPVN